MNLGRGMSTLSAARTISFKSALAIGFMGVVLAFGGFQLGRQSVNLPGGTSAIATRGSEVKEETSNEALRQEQTESLRHATMRNIATVPFTQLYDILRIATPEQLASWAEELEAMPEGPRRTASVTAFYKSLIQINPAAALDALERIRNKSLQETAAIAVLETAPESIWGNIVEAFERIPYPRDSWESPLENWSRVDPVAVSHFIETHPKERGVDDEEDDRVTTLLWEWARMDPAAAKEWMEADPARQTEEALTTWTLGFAEHDVAGVDFLIAHADQENYADAIRRFTYGLFLESRGEVMAFVSRLPPEQSRMAVRNIADMTAAFIVGSGRRFQQPPAEVANWLITVPTDLWPSAIGKVVGRWLMEKDSSAAADWLQQLTSRERDIVLGDLCRVSTSQFGGRPTEIVSEIILLGLTISDPQLRDDSLSFAVGHLADNDDERQAAIDALPISPAKKEYLRRLPLRDEHE